MTGGISVDPERVAALEAEIAILSRSVRTGEARLAALERYTFPADMLPQAMDRTASARGWTAINIQMMPYDLIAADLAAGIDQQATYHRLAYLAHGEAAIRMAEPQPPVSEIIRILWPAWHEAWHAQDADRLAKLDPPIIRTPINKWQFDADGTMLSADYQRLLDEWAAEGGRLQFVSAWLGQEDWPHPVKAEGDAAMLAYLHGVADVVIEGWQRLGLWYARQSPEMQQSIVALEVFNEPAIYDKAITARVMDRRDAIDLFVDHQIAIARQGMDWWRGPIMPTLFAYSSRTAELLEPDADGVTGLDRIRRVFGWRLIWSVHRYPGWIKRRTPHEWRDTLLAGLEPLRPDPVVITEINADLGGAADDFSYQAARVMGEIAAEGIGIGWFSGINFGAALVSFWGRPAIRNIDRVAAFWDAASVNARQPSATLERFQVNRSRLDARGGHDSAIHRIVGAPGSDTIAPTEAAATLIYGNAGDDAITINPTHATWVFGQAGHDVIDASTGPFAILILGPGDDTVRLGADQLYVYGGGDGDSFVLADRGAAVIDNFAIGEDRIEPDGLAVTAANDGADLILTTPSGGTVRLLGLAGVTLSQLTS